MQRDCKLPDGRPVCCAAVYNNVSTTITTDINPYYSLYNKGIGVNFGPSGKVVKNKVVRNHDIPNTTIIKTNKCTIYKEYISSPLELQELEIAKQIEQIPGDLNTQYMIQERYEALLNYVTSVQFIKNSTIWLNRVKLHMQSPFQLPTTITDLEFLSRFIYTRKCNNDEIEHQWIEWIEPIGITLRHPFAFGSCRQTSRHYTKQKPRVWRSNVDYVLLQSGVSLYNQTHTNTGKRINLVDTVLINEKKEYMMSKDKNVLIKPNNRLSNPKHYMLDAGTSTFDSSLFWFTCSYSQVYILYIHNHNNMVGIIILLTSYMIRDIIAIEKSRF